MGFEMAPVSMDDTEDAPQAPRRLLSKRDIEQLLPERLIWRRIFEVDRHCVDGRSFGPHGIVGGPGGDEGLLITALAACEEVRDAPFDTAEVQRLMGHLPGTRYLHTDEHAQGAALQAILQDPVLAKEAQSEEEAGKLLERGYPDGAIRERLLLVLLKPESLGCGHLKNMLLHPQEYGVRQELVRACLRASYEALWKHERPPVVECLLGEHREGAVVNITAESQIEDGHSPIPAIRPSSRDGGPQFFINHPQYTAYRIRELAHSLQSEVPEVGEEELVATMAKLESRGTEETLHRLARGLPLYTVIFRGRTSCTVHEEGTVS
jgi:hypothetical protein